MAVNFIADDYQPEEVVNENVTRHGGAGAFSDKLEDLEMPTFSISDITRGGGFGLSNVFGSVSDTKTTEFIETLDEIMKNLRIDSSIKRTVVSIPSDDLWLSHFAIVIEKGNDVYAAAFGIEGTNIVDIPDKVLKDRDRVVTRLKRYCSNVHTKENTIKIAERISEEYGKKVSLINTSVISKEIDAKSKKAVTDVVQPAVSKILTRFIHTGINPIIMTLRNGLEKSEERRNRASLLLNIDNVNTTVYDANQRPIAADIKFTFVLENNTNGSGEPIDASSNTRNLGTVYGIWSAVPSKRSDSKDNENQCLVANLTITHITGDVVVDPAWTAILAAQVTTVLQKYEFLRYMVSNQQVIEKLGAMNIYVNEDDEVGYGSAVELDPFEHENNMLLIKDWFYPNASVSLLYDPMNPASVAALRVYEASGGSEKPATNMICDSIELAFELEQQTCPEPFERNTGVVYMGGRYTTADRSKNEDNTVRLYTPQNLFSAYKDSPKVGQEHVLNMIDDGGWFEGVVDRQQMLSALSHNTGQPDSIVTEYTFNPKFLELVVEELIDLGIEPNVSTTAPRLARGRNSVENRRASYNGRSSGTYSSGRDRGRSNRWSNDGGNY